MARADLCRRATETIPQKTPVKILCNWLTFSPPNISDDLIFHSSTIYTALIFCVLLIIPIVLFCLLHTRFWPVFSHILVLLSFSFGDRCPTVLLPVKFSIKPQMFFQKKTPEKPRLWKHVSIIYLGGCICVYAAYGHWLRT